MADVVEIWSNYAALLFAMGFLSDLIAQENPDCLLLACVGVQGNKIVAVFYYT